MEHPTSAATLEPLDMGTADIRRLAAVELDTIADTTLGRRADQEASSELLPGTVVRAISTRIDAGQDTPDMTEIATIVGATIDKVSSMIPEIQEAIAHFYEEFGHLTRVRVNIGSDLKVTLGLLPPAEEEAE